MADPVTWGVILAGVGTGISAVGAIRQGQANANAMNFNSGMAKINAQIADDQSVAAGDALNRDIQRRMGSATAAYGASGVQLSEGSPSDVLAESARLATLDAATLKYNYRLKGMGFQAQSTLDSASAENSRTASYFNAAGSMLSGGSSVASMFK